MWCTSCPSQGVFGIRVEGEPRSAGNTEPNLSGEHLIARAGQEHGDSLLMLHDLGEVQALSSSFIPDCVVPPKTSLQVESKMRRVGRSSTSVATTARVDKSSAGDRRRPPKAAMTAKKVKGQQQHSTVAASAPPGLHLDRWSGQS